MILDDTLTQVWSLRYALSHPDEYRKGMAFSYVKLVGLRQDKKFLTGLGLKGMVGPSGVFFTWDQVEKAYQSNMKFEMNRAPLSSR